MSEFDNRSDRLTATLDTLRSDLERIPLADSMTVRRRGDQRTRRQAVGGAVAVCAVIVGAAGVYGGVGGSDRATQVPATGGPTASTSVETPLALAADPLLEPADIGDIGPYTGWRRNDDQAEIDQQRHQCVPSPTKFDASEVVFGTFYNDLDSSAVEHVLRFGDAASATAAADALVTDLTGCELGAASDHVVQGDPQPVQVSGADSAVTVSRDAAPPDSEVSHYELGVVREGNVLVVLQWNSMGLPDGVTQIWDSQRLTAAIDRAVG